MVSVGSYQTLLTASTTLGGVGGFAGRELLDKQTCGTLGVTAAGIALAGAVLAVFPGTQPAALGYGIIAGVLGLVYAVSCQ